jgi:hypothetical protein
MPAEPSEDTILREYLEQSRQECRSLVAHSGELTLRINEREKWLKLNGKFIAFLACMWVLTMGVAVWGWTRKPACVPPAHTMSVEADQR